MPGMCFNPAMQVDAYIALGTNQGDRELNLLRAVAEVGRLPESRITGLSPFYETSPVGVTDQPAFYNAVLRLSTLLSHDDLFAGLVRIENDVFKRKRTIVWGPRSMDLDLLLYGDMVIDTEQLKVPHPRMTERLFVLQPLHDLAPELKHPVSGMTVGELLRVLVTDETVVRI